MTENESFETSLKKLEQAVEQLETGELSLEQSLHWFENGVQCANRCQKLLREVETRVDMLLKDREGNLSMTEFNQE